MKAASTLEKERAQVKGAGRFKHLLAPGRIGRMEVRNQWSCRWGPTMPT